MACPEQLPLAVSGNPEDLMANHKQVTQIYHTCQQRLLHLAQACMREDVDPVFLAWPKRFKQRLTKSNNKEFLR